jgi:TonB family protein
MKKNRVLRLTAFSAAICAAGLLGVLPAITAQTSEGRDASVVVKEAFAPQYPRVALAAQVQGTVRVKVTVASDGSVSKAEALSGSPMLLPLVLEAAKKWKFESEHERTAELEFRFEALPSTAAKDQIGAVYMPPMTVLVRDRVPVIPDSPHAKSEAPKRETVTHEAGHAEGVAPQQQR